MLVFSFLLCVLFLGSCSERPLCTQPRISQGLDQDVCDTADCAVRMLQVASGKTPEGPKGEALAEESSTRSIVDAGEDA